jgi:hypothetical protein
MQIRSVVVVAALGLSSFAHGQSAAVQWRVQDGGNGHWYQVVVSAGIQWPQAKLLSEDAGGHLACGETISEIATSSLVFRQVTTRRRGCRSGRGTTSRSGLGSGPFNCQDLPNPRAAGLGLRESHFSRTPTG